MHGRGGQRARIESAALLRGLDGRHCRSQLGADVTCPLRPGNNLIRVRRAVAQGRRDLVHEGGLRPGDAAHCFARLIVWNGDGNQKTERDAHNGADEGVRHAHLGRDIRCGNGEDEHRADRCLESLISESQQVGDDERRRDHPGKAPPRQPQIGGGSHRDQHTREHGADAHQSHPEGAHRRRLHHQQRGERGGEVEDAREYGVGNDVGDGRRDREAGDLHGDGPQSVAGLSPGCGHRRPYPPQQLARMPSGQYSPPLEPCAHGRWLPNRRHSATNRATARQ